MIDDTSLEEFRGLGLMRHQALFAANFVSEDSPAHHLLVGRGGMGKGFLGATLCVHMFTRSLARRILIMAPAVICRCYLDSLTRAVGLDSVALVNVRKFREMEANVEVGTSPWPKPFIAILSYSVAKSEQIASSLFGCHWDLLVVDEAHQLKGRTLSEVELMIRDGVVSRCFFMTATPSKDLLRMVDREFRRTDWRPDEEIDWHGHILTLPEPGQKLIKFERSRGEIEFLEALQSFLNLMITTKTANSLKVLLLEKAASSVFAVEERLLRLRRIRNDIVHLGTVAIPQDLFDPMEDWDEEIGEYLASIDFLQDFQETENLFDFIDEISKDQKLEALYRLLKELTNDANGVCRRICVFSAHAQTVLYLESSLTDVGYDVAAFTAALYGEEGTETGARVQDSKPSLLVTSASEVWTDQDIDILIHYDLPASEADMEQRRGRFNRWGRSKPLKELAFRDKSGVLPFEENLLRMYFPALCV
ncbi:MAG: helicase-related protein [Desulfomonilaceae bacterium]